MRAPSRPASAATRVRWITMQRCFAQGSRPLKPIRTALFAPGIRDRVMAKALDSGADAVILDLEDSVPLAAKTEARALVANVINGFATGNAPHPVIIVRVNAFSTGLLAQ